MEDNDLISPAFEEAFQRAIAAAEQSATALTSATAQDADTPDTEDDDDEDEVVVVTEPEDASEEDESDDEESTDDQDDDDDEDSEDEDSDDEDPADDETDETDDETEAVEDKPQPDSKKKSRRSKTVTKLKDKLTATETELTKLREEASTLEERVAKRVQEAQQRTAALESQRRQREQEDAQIEQEVAFYLGDDNEYRNAIQIALDYQRPEEERQEAAKAAQAWDNNRTIIGKLAKRAEGHVKRQAAQIFWEAAGPLEGVDREIIQSATLADLFPYLHKTGYDIGVQASGASLAAKDAEIEKLNRKITRLEAKTTEDKVTKVVRKPQPIDTGKPVAKKKVTTDFERLQKNELDLDRWLDEKAGRTPLLV